MANTEEEKRIMQSLDKIAKNINANNSKYLSTLVYDNTTNDKSLIIKDNETNKEQNIDIKNEYNGFYIKDKNEYSVELKDILNSENYNKLKHAHKEHENESFILNKQEINNLEKKNILEQSNVLDLNKRNELNNDPVYKVLSEDNDLMKQSLLYYQKNQVLDVLTKAREQLENVNHAIRNGIDSEQTRSLQASLNDDVRHLESKSNKLSNSISNNNVLDKINSKLEKNKEQAKEQTANNDVSSSKTNRKRTKTQEHSL